MTHILWIAILLNVHRQSFAAQDIRPAADAGCALGLLPGRALGLPPGYSIKPEVVIGLEAQGRVRLAPVNVYAHPDGRVEDTVLMNVDGKSLLVTTSERDGKVRIVDVASGDVLRSFSNLHVEDRAGWSPRIALADAASGLVITEGGTTDYAVVDVRQRRLRGKLRVPASRQKAKSLYEFVSLQNNSRSVFALARGGQYATFSTRSAADKFKFASAGNLAVMTARGPEKIRDKILDVTFTDDRHVWAAIENRGIFKFNLDAKIIERDEADLLIGEPVLGFADGLVKKIALDRQRKTLWIVTEVYAADLRADRYAAVPEKINVYLLDLESGATTLGAQNVGFGSRVKSLFVGAHGAMLTLRDPESAVVFLNQNGLLSTKWQIERSATKWYLSSLSGPFDPLHSVAYAPNGQIAATGSDGGILALWDLTTGALLGLTDTGASDLRGLSFSPDSRTLAVGGHMGVARIYAVDALNSATRSSFVTNLPSPSHLNFLE